MFNITGIYGVIFIFQWVGIGKLNDIILIINNEKM